MWMVTASSYWQITAQVDCLGLWVGGHLALSLHLSDEPRELFSISEP